MTRRQSDILDLLTLGGPQTDVDLLRHYEEWIGPISPSGLRSRRAELVKAGCVEATGQRVVLESGRTARLWRVRV